MATGLLGAARAGASARALLACVIGLSIAAGGWAQSMSMSRSYMSSADGRPEIAAQDIEVIARVLELGGAEREVIDALYEEYREGILRDYDAVRDEVEDIIEEAMVRNNQRIAERAQPIVAAWATEKESREKAFLEELTVVLTDEQSSRWPLVERELRRIKGLDGVMSGEGVDVIRLSQAEVGPDLIESADLGPMLERYSVELDNLLRERDGYKDDHYDEFMEAQESDPERAQALWQRMREKRTALRDLNARTVRGIAARLSAEGTDAAAAADRFVRAWQTEALGWRARKSTAQTRLERALELTTLDGPQRATLDALAERSQAALDVAQRDLLAAVFDLETEPLEDVNSIGTASSDDRDFMGYEEGSPMARVSERMLEIDREIIRTIRDTLTAAQRRSIRREAVLATVFRKDGGWMRF